MSRSNHLPLIAGLSLSMGLLAGLAQAGERLLPAAKIFPFLQDYLSLSPSARDRFAPIYVFRSKTGKLAGTQAWLVVDGARTPLSIAADGQIGAPTSVAQVARGQVALSLPPESKMGVRMEVTAIVPLRAEIAEPLLEASLAQANSALHTGVPLISPPRFRRLVFEGAQGGEVVSVDGQRRQLPTRDGVAYYEPSPEAHDAVLRFRQPPSHVILSSDR